MTRRFFSATIYGLWGLISAALAVPSLAYLLVPGRRTTGDSWVEVGDLTGVPANTPTEVTFHRVRQDGWKTTTEKAAAWVVRTSTNEVTAFVPLCTHLGCAYRWDAQKSLFECPCHDSFFEVDGSVLSGPATRPLDRFETRVQGERLWIGQQYSAEDDSA